MGVPQKMTRVLISCVNVTLTRGEGVKKYPKILRMSYVHVPPLGPYLNDFRNIFGFVDPPPPFIRISRNLSVLSVCKIGQFLNPPPPIRADVI